MIQLWSQAFAVEAENIGNAMGDVAINVYHVGSTAVPGMQSKPIVDILVTVRDIASLTSYRVPLERIGYAFSYDSEFPDFHFFGNPQERPRRYHIHVCQEDSVHERRHLAVRDYLRTYSKEAAKYGSIKGRIAREFPGDRQRYMEEKSPYVENLEQRALAWPSEQRSHSRRSPVVSRALPAKGPLCRRDRRLT